MVQIARWVFFCVERSWCFNASLSRYREHGCRFEKRVEVVGGCGTEEPARYRVAVARLRKGRDRDKRSAFSKDGMRSQRYPSFNLLLREKKG
jgi:hypothetical protein